eukprot:COSAG02_NODE_4996_length_4738_cov_2.522526_6_plen_520_part_00
MVSGMLGAAALRRLPAFRRMAPPSSAPLGRTCAGGLERRSSWPGAWPSPVACSHRRLYAAGTAADATTEPVCSTAAHRMRFASAVAHCEQWVEHRDASAVADDLIEQLHTQLCGQAPDLLIFFNASSTMAPLHGRDVARELRTRCATRWESSCPVVLGASWGSAGPGTGVIGGTGNCHEIQESAALTVLGASLPSVRVMPFHADPEHDGLPTLIGGSWADLALLPESEAPHVLLLSDPSQLGLGPYSDRILKYFDNALPFSAKVGGLVPGGGLISLECNGGETAVGTQGVGGVVLQGDIEVDTLVCQGASPFGPVFEVTACDGSTVFELDGEPAAQRVIEILEQSRQIAAAHHDETASAASDTEGSASDGDGAAAEQWAADGLPAQDQDPEWETAPEDILHLLAGVQVDGTPTRGEVTLLTADQTTVTNAPEYAKISLPSIRISSDFVARHIVKADTASGGIQIDISSELLQEGMRLQLHAFTRQSALDEVSGMHSHQSTGICSDTPQNPRQGSQHCLS